MFYKAWVSKGILRIKDILSGHDNFLSFQNLKDTFDVCGTCLDYGGLLAAIPKDWKSAILHGGNQEHADEPMAGAPNDNFRKISVRKTI